MRKNCPNLSNFLNFKNFQIVKTFTITLRYVAKNIVLSIFSFFPQLSYLVCNQSNQIWLNCFWLNYFMDGCHFDYITKPPKSNTGWWWLQGHFSPAPFSSMLLIGFTGPSSLLNRLFFIGFITPAKEGGTLMSKKSLYKTIPGRVTAHSTWCNPIQSCLARNLRSFHLLLPPRLLLQTRIKIVYLYVYYLVYNSFSPPYLLSFQVTI